MTQTELDRSVQADFYAALMSHSIHQDQLQWSRVQLLVALQAAILVAGYASRGSWLAAAELLLGAALTTALGCLLALGHHDITVNWPVMDRLAWDLTPEHIVRQLGRTRPQAPVLGDGDLIVRFTSNRPGWRQRFPAHRIIVWVVKFFVVLDLVLAVIFLLFPAIFPDISRR